MAENKNESNWLNGATKAAAKNLTGVGALLFLIYTISLVSLIGLYETSDGWFQVVWMVCIIVLVVFVIKNTMSLYR